MTKHFRQLKFSNQSWRWTVFDWWCYRISFVVHKQEQWRTGAQAEEQRWRPWCNPSNCSKTHHNLCQELFELLYESGEGNKIGGSLRKEGRPAGHESRRSGQPQQDHKQEHYTSKDLLRTDRNQWVSERIVREFRKRVKRERGKKWGGEGTVGAEGTLVEEREKLGKRRNWSETERTVSREREQVRERGNTWGREGTGGREGTSEEEREHVR